MHKDYLYWIWLSLKFRPGTGGFTELLEKFDGPYQIYVADERELSARLGAGSPLVKLLLDKNLSRAHRIYEFCVSWNIGILTYGEIAYPARLRTIQNPPMLLYYVGNLPTLDRRLCIAVVGTRKMSEYGKRMAYKISYELASAGSVVVSGMALGCDAVASAGAIAANGTTVAILGSGIDVVYPPQHATLMEHIKQHGIVMTEFPPGTPPEPGNFPIRNRIISGLSQGTLAIEGDKRSGSLLTVAHAVKQGRQIFAVPGNVGETNAEGTNELIRNGATVVLNAGDVLARFEVTDKELIDYENYQRSLTRSELNEAVLLRMDVSMRVDPPASRAKRSSADAQTPVRPRTAYAPAPAASEKTRSVANPELRPTPVAKAGVETAEKEPPRVRQTITVASSLNEVTALSGDGSHEVLASLSERERKIFAEMPIDRAVSIDRLSALGFSVGDIMTAMTILEIRGLVTSLPGGLYLKK